MQQENNAQNGFTDRKYRANEPVFRDHRKGAGQHKSAAKEYQTITCGIMIVTRHPLLGGHIRITPESSWQTSYICGQIQANDRHPGGPLVMHRAQRDQ
ncbi:hypothetical protein [Leisingera daeponensis]|uniref:hypothetical protein n=1 Tax=Leisingera daeponensis TaxID=405746 RepID=UPI001C940328|nr:hypothetical protein [Leisingera daeponensis]MBY6059013.1 hypothetical protein [Leisingera daeponensis]